MQAEVNILRGDGDRFHVMQDCVALEEPLEIVVNGESLAVTMRTPGDDFALTVGFLYSESVIADGQDIAAMGYARTRCKRTRQNVVEVMLRDGLLTRSDRVRLQRNVLTTSACGVCGKATLEAAQCLALPLPESDWAVTPDIIQNLNGQMRQAQAVFERTGGLHAAGLFDHDGKLLSLREDVGRHNALDKLIGAEVLAGRTPLSEQLLLVSGRASFELMQKAAMARIPIVCAVSAPSSLAVQLARDLNMTLIGFLRGETMNVYAGAQRIVTNA